jgi:hypothetical protein
MRPVLTPPAENCDPAVPEQPPLKVSSELPHTLSPILTCEVGILVCEVLETYS